LKGIGKVFIPKEAYFTIIASCYRFANPTIVKDQWAEVQGALYGYNSGNDVHVVKAVPLTHLSHIEVKMYNEDYVALATYEDEMARHGYFQVGWYHSHPGIKVMLSLEDVKTQAGLQAPNPLSIALVFNHELLLNGDGDPGFKIFRLEDPTTIEMRYYEVPFEITSSTGDILKEARQVLFMVQRHLSGDNAVEIILKKIKNAIKDIDSEIFGLKNHLNNLAMKGKEHLMKNSFLKHKSRIERLVKSRRERSAVQLELLNYLELRELSRYKDQIAEIKQEWHEFEESIPVKMQEISNVLEKSKDIILTRLKNKR